MTFAFSIFYALALLCFLTGTVFILYHMIRFSFSKTSSFTMVVVFLAGLGILLAINIISFLNTNIEDVLNF